MPLDLAARRLGTQLGNRGVARASSGEQHVVDLARQLGEEPREPVEICGIEGGDARTELEPGVEEAVRIAGRDDHTRSLIARAPSGREPDARAPADHHDSLPLELELVAHVIAWSPAGPRPRSCLPPHLVSAEPRTSPAASRQGDSLVFAPASRSGREFDVGSRRSC
jgi:hypothetical protein